MSVINTIRGEIYSLFPSRKSLDEEIHCTLHCSPSIKLSIFSELMRTGTHIVIDREVDITIIKELHLPGNIHILIVEDQETGFKIEK